jgi:hypothetical protein
MLDGLGEQLAGLVEIVAGVKHPLDLRAVLSPLFELVEIAIVRAKRVVRFFVGPGRLVGPIFSQGSDYSVSGRECPPAYVVRRQIELISV